MDMRISSVYSAYNAQPSNNINKTERAGKGRDNADKVSISAQAGDYQTARNAVANTPDIRENIVSRIQEMLDSGTYNVSDMDVATSILMG